MKKRSLLLILLSLVFATTTITAVSVFAKDGAATFSEINIEENYGKNQMITIPEVTMTLSGNNYPTQAILIAPDGTATEVNGNAILTQNGQYTLRYDATVGNKTYSTSKSFYAYLPKFELSSSEDAARYVENAVEDKNGEFVSLSQDQSLTINDYFDITNATFEEPIFQAVIEPATVGSIDFSTLQVDFISKKNPKEYLRVIGNYSTENHCTYYLAGANNQTPTGFEAYGSRLHVGDNWGAAVAGSFDGTLSNGNALDCSFKIYLNYETKEVRAQYLTFVIDLDDSQYFGDLWTGFTDGEVYIKISASRYVSTRPAQFYILKAGDIDLSEQNIFDTVAPELDIDFGDEDENDLPSGIVGNKYRLFNATATDKLSGECAVKTRVFGRYNQSGRFEAEISDGYFTPECGGEYLIRYSTKDKSGNETVKEYTVNVYETYPDLSVTLENKTEAALNGELVKIADYEVANNLGCTKVEYSVTVNGEKVEVVDGCFRPEKTGGHIVGIKVTDYSGRTAEESYTVIIGENKRPLFIDKINLPHYLIGGSNYKFDVVYAYDYSVSGQVKRVKATLVSEDKNGTVEHADDCYEPSVNEHLETVKIYYKAVLSNVTATSEKFDIPICTVGSAKDIDISKYFISSNVNIEKANEGTVFTTDANKAKVDFANQLLAHGASFEFNVNADKNSFSKINVYLTDVENEDEVLKITYEKINLTTSSFYVNGGTKYGIPSSFFGQGQNPFSFKYDNAQLTVSDNANVSFPVKKKLSGEDFNGFSSGKVYFTLEFEGVEGESSIVLSKLNGQNTTSVKADLIRPRIALVNPMAFRHNLNDVVSLSPAIALDVLDPSIESYYTVTDANGNIMSDINGVRLEKVALNESHDIKLTDYGVYRVSFTALDWNGKRETDFGYVLEAVDVSAPAIVFLEEKPKTAKVGDSIVLPKILTIDEVDGETGMTVFVRLPDGSFKKLSESFNRYTQEGKYVIYLYTFDSAGNTAVRDFEVTVGD